MENFESKIENILKQTQILPYSHLFLKLQDYYQFSFNLISIVKGQIFQQIREFNVHFFRLLLLHHVRPISAPQQITTKIEELIAISILKIRKQYYIITQLNLSRKKQIKEIEIIIFLIALASKFILIELLSGIQVNLFSEDSKSLSETNEEEGQFDIQEEIYIILINQTLGKLVSPFIFRMLHKKFIKQVIPKFNGSPSIQQIEKSMKKIKQDILNNQNMGISRKQRQRSRKLKTSFLNPLNIFKNEIKKELKIKHPMLIEINAKPQNILKQSLKLYKADSNRVLTRREKHQRNRKYSFCSVSCSADMFLKKNIEKKKKCLFQEKTIRVKDEISSNIVQVPKIKFNRILDKREDKQNINWANTLSTMKADSQRELGAIQKLKRFNLEGKNNIHSVRNTHNIKIENNFGSNNSISLKFSIIKKNSAQKIPLKDKSKYLNIQKSLQIQDGNRNYLQLNPQKRNIIDSHQVKKNWRNFIVSCDTRKQTIEEIDKYYRI